MKIQKKYIVIAKINQTKFVKYRVNNLMKFSDFLKREFGGYRYFNVYDKKTRMQLDNFSCKNPPITKHLS